MALQIPTVPPFKPYGDQNTVAQRWARWKKSFNYFVRASGIANEDRKQALLMHLIGPETQKIYESINQTQNQTYEETLTTLNNHFEIQKNVPFEQSVFHKAEQKSGENIEQFVTRLRELSLHYEYGNNTDDNIRDQVMSKCTSTKLRK